MEKEALERIRKKLLASLSKDDNEADYSSRLLEEGIKSLFIVPVFFNYLGFDDIDDYQFEAMPIKEKNLNERADIIIKNKFIIETKRFNLLKDEQEHIKAKKQLLEYLSPKDEYEYGILTDGFIWELYLERTFIEKIAYKSNTLSLKEKIPLCLEFSLKDEDFWDWLSILHKEIIEDNMERLAKGIVNISLCKKGAVAFHHLFKKLEDDSDKRADMGQNVRDQLDIRFGKIKGEYFDEVEKGKYAIGELLEFDDEIIKIVVKILEDGRIEIIPEKTIIIDQDKVVEGYPYFLKYRFDIWQNDPNSKIYKNRIDIFKSIIGKGKKKTKWKRSK